MDFFSNLLETQETVVYNASHGEAFVSLGEYQSSGGLAQLGEHYVRNVGVGGSTPLPSTKPRLRVPLAFPPSLCPDKHIEYLDSLYETYS